MQERIIQFLKESDGYISGEEISQRLKMSRAAIWKHMQELRAQGYEIAAVPHLGYQLVTCPDKLIELMRSNQALTPRSSVKKSSSWIQSLPPWMKLFD